MHGPIKEEAAKERVCPIISDADSTILCLGSACMFWRWSRAETTIQFKDKLVEHAKTSEVTNHNKLVQELLNTDIHRQYEHTEGYCGHAVNPDAKLLP